MAADMKAVTGNAPDPGAVDRLSKSPFYNALLLRAANIPAYGVSGVFIEEGDNRAHGKDERIRLSHFYAGLDFYDRFIRVLVGR